MTKFLYALNILKTNTNLKCALSAYYAYAYAWLRYAVVLWGDSTEAGQLFVMQKKCVRILANVRIPNSCRPHFIQLRLLTLPCLYILQAALFARENSHLFQLKPDKENTRVQYRNKLLVPKTNLVMCKKSPHYKCILITNKIPNSIKLESRNSVFKKKLENLLIDKCYYSVKDFLNDDSL
jgi:hypothetical protein